MRSDDDDYQEATNEDRLEPDNEREVVKHGRLPSRVVYEIVRRDGLEELARPNSSLVWSGIAAGITISFSLVTMALLREFLPDTPWRPLIESIGYTVGFLLVILGRLQLFTENTLTTVIPFCHHPESRLLLSILRLWSIVFAANIAGTTIAAAFIAYSGAFPPQTLSAIGEISLHMLDRSTYDTFVLGIPAGILVASIVWVMPSSGSGAFWIIVFFTYVISLGGFAHVVAGSTEAAYLVLTGQSGLAAAFSRFLAPALAGNVVGGTVVFALLAYGQIRGELE